jgi:hypothetical protein
MAFTVARNDGTTRYAEFEAYARLLRQQGVDLGKLPRVPEPGIGRRWLYAWQDKAGAEAFASELRKRTRDASWTVVEVAAPTSEGPLGPLIVQVGRRSTGLAFQLHPSSRAMIQSAYPDVKVLPSTISIEFQTLQDFTTTYGSIAVLAAEVVPTLTRLEPAELREVGYALVEDDTHRTLLFVRPGDLAQAGGNPQSTSPGSASKS